MRPLGIPTVRDRVVQTALRNALEPIFERDFAAQSYGFRPKRGCKDALREVAKQLEAGQHYFACFLRECQWHERASEMGSAPLGSANPTLR